MKRFAWCLLAACHAAPAPPAPTASNQDACAPALPLLAKQHTPNASRLYLAPISAASGSVHVGAPVLATTKLGYVNQPAFAADGSGLYFTWRPDGSQADIWFRDAHTGAEHPVTCTSVEEYAAVPVPDGLVVVRVQADLSRTLVALDRDGHDRAALFPALTNVGAQLWLDATTAVIFDPGPDSSTPSRLIVANAQTGALATAAQDVGAAMAVIPGTRAISYIDNHDEHHPMLMKLDVDTRATSVLMALPEGADNVAWLSDGSVLRGMGTQIMRASPAAPDWQPVADLAGAIAGPIQRVVVHGDTLAVVVHVE